MKKTTFLISFIIVSLVGFMPSSDAFKFSIGKVTKIGTTTSKIIGKFGDDVIVLSGTFKKVHFVKMQGTKFIKKVPLNLKYKDKNMNYEGSFINKNKLYYLTSFYNAKTHKEFYFYKEFNTKSMKDVGELNLIGEVPVRSKSRLGSIGVVQSNDSTKTVLYLFNPDKGKNKQEIVFIVLDQDLQVVWKKSTYLKYLDKEFRITSVTIDNKGTVYFAGKKYIKKSSRKSVPYKYHILIFKEGEEEADDIEINLKKYFINDMALRIANNGDIVFAGFYSPDESWSIDGSFYLRLDGKSHEVASNNYKEFPLSFISQGHSEYQKKKAKKKEKKGKNIQLYKYDLSDIIMRTDGGIILVAEQYYSVTYTTTTANGGTTTHTTYYYNDIIIVNIDNKGNIVWNKKISKYQMSGNPWPFSYALGVYDNNIYFVVNDNPKNRLQKPSHSTRAYGGRKDVDIIIYTVEPKGDIKKTFVKNTKPYKFIMHPYLTYFDDTEGVFYISSLLPRKSIRIGTIELN